MAPTVDGRTMSASHIATLTFSKRGGYAAGGMKLYRYRDGPVVEDETGNKYLLETEWDDLINRNGLAGILESMIREGSPVKLNSSDLLPPLMSQEIWAAGVTYFRSRDARMRESEKAGGGSFYDKIYDAERPELFYKGSARTAVGHGDPVRIRSDSQWNVPEPELTLMIDCRGHIIGYTVGNDMSSRDIEGANPLYLPQAKVYDGSCALGPGILISDDPLESGIGIRMSIERAGVDVYSGSTTLAALKRSPDELASFLYTENTFPHGCLLMTGTGIVPPDDFSLQSKDRITITIDEVGTLINTVA
jgi:2-dehydro-3-deoxy-D-arabinonate dehydratase